MSVSHYPLTISCSLCQIKWFKGRDQATKVKTIELVIVAVSEAFGCSTDAVTVNIEDLDEAFLGRGCKPCEKPFFYEQTIVVTIHLF